MKFVPFKSDISVTKMLKFISRRKIRPYPVDKAQLVETSLNVWWNFERGLKRHVGVPFRNWKLKKKDENEKQSYSAKERNKQDIFSNSLSI